MGVSASIYLCMLVRDILFLQAKVRCLAVNGTSNLRLLLPPSQKKLPNLLLLVARDKAKIQNFAADIVLDVKIQGLSNGV